MGLGVGILLISAFYGIAIAFFTRRLARYLWQNPKYKPISIILWLIAAACLIGGVTFIILAIHCLRVWL